MKSKKHKTAVVSGGTRGIGKAIVERLVKENYFVIIADLENEIKAFKKLESVKQKNILPVACDITKAKDVQNLFKQAKKQGEIYLLVNNAGIIRDNLIDKMPEEDFDKVIAVNLKGTWLMCKEAADSMKNQGFGRIVNIASRAWLGNRGQSNYSAAKAGVVSLTRVLALELGKYNICVNAVAPGLIDTPLTQKLKPEVLEKLIQSQPGKNIGKPDDVAKAVSFLGSHETNFITGQVLYVDGGKSVGSNLV